MADSIMSSLVNPLIEKFRDYVLNHICYTINVSANVCALDGEVDKLKRKRKDVEDEIQLGDTARKVATEEAKGWLETAAKLVEEASSIRSKYRNRNCMFLGTGCSFNCFSNHSIGMSSIEAKAKVEAEIQRLENNIKEITKDPPPSPVQEVPTATLGAETGSEIKSKLDMALDFLRSSPEGTLGIWGMGGVGKTTLLRHINNRLAEEDPSSFGFNRVVLVTAARGCTTEKIRELIAKELKLPEQGDHYTNIFNYLKNKSFVILLDDVWERLDLENVGVPTLGVAGEVKRKLIMASRSHQVCHSMDARDNTMRVDCLSPEKARQLFKEKVGEETIRSHPLISRLADTVADECCGLPLALIAIARAMTGKRLVNLWRKAIKDLRESKPSEISSTEDPLPLLKISYDYLNDPRMQECLLLCALWPEDWKIPAAKVIECWMGHNLLGEFDNLKDAYDKGHEIIDRLQKASLLEYSEDEYEISGEGTVSLHDLIRDMALLIARDCGANDKKWVVLANLELKETPQDERSWKEAHKMSLMRNYGMSTWPSHIQSAPNLTTLMLQRSLQYSRNFKIHDLDILRNLHALKYLDMSGNRVMGEFPIAICQLDKLEYLNLSNCGIDSLPEEVKNLKSLKYLLLRDNKIKEVSSQVLSNLVSLEVLDLFRVYPLNDNIDNLVECLKGRRLKSLGINVSSQSESDLNKLARFSVVPIIRDLCIGTRRVRENLTSSIHLLPRLNIPCDGTLSNLNELYIVGDFSSVIEELVIDESHGSLPKRLDLKDLEVKEIVWKGVEQRDMFPKLRDIRLFRCNQLKHVSWIVNLPLLERLVLIECRSIEHVVCEEATETEGEGNNNKTATLPSLKILHLFNLPGLESIWNRALITLPSLQCLQVYGCPRLKKLPFDSPASCSKLRKIDADEEWWKATLELDDDTRTHLQPFCDLY